MLLERASRPIHVSWLLAALCLGVVLGLVLPFGMVQIHTVEWLLIAATLAFVGVTKKKVYCLALMVLGGFLIGLFRAEVYNRQVAPYSQLMDTVVELNGTVSDDSDIGKRGEVILRLSAIEIKNHPIGGAVWVSVQGSAEVKRSDIVTIKGNLSPGFGSFAASMFQAEFLAIERPSSGDVALDFRDWFAGGVREAIPEPEASLGAGYILGQRRSLPEDLDAALKATGLTHVVVASGYNLTILVNVARRIFVRLSKFLAAFFSGGLIISFIAITGLSPSMSRAGLVAGLGLLAWYYGRRFHPIILLLLAAAITLLIEPAYAKGDLGWQLSFASFAGVLVVGPLLQSFFYGDEKPSIIRQILFETISAFICTLPLIVLAFGQFSNVAVLANLLVLPLIPLAMALTFFAGGVALLLPALASFAGFPAFIVLGYMARVTMYLGDLPWAQTEISINPLIGVFYYVVLAGICLYMWKATGYRFGGRPSLE